jgi:hypothetical protein
MGGNTGNLRTLRNQSAVNGSRTLFSILASDGGSGAGSVRRVYGYYAKNGEVDKFYQMVFDIKYGQFKNRTQWFLSNNFV